MATWKALAGSSRPFRRQKYVPTYLFISDNIIDIYDVMCTRVLRLTGLYVECKASVRPADDGQAVGIDERHRGIILQNCQPNKTEIKTDTSKDVRMSSDPLSKLSKSRKLQITHRMERDRERENVYL